MSLAHISLGAELFLMLVQVHRLCNAVLINAGIGSIGSTVGIVLTSPTRRATEVAAVCTWHWAQRPNANCLGWSFVPAACRLASSPSHELYMWQCDTTISRGGLREIELLGSFASLNFLRFPVHRSNGAFNSLAIVQCRARA